MGIPVFPIGRPGFAFYQPGQIPPPPPASAHVVPPFPFPQQALDTTYGVDVLCLTDLDPYLSLTPALPQDLFHLVTEGPGSLFWAPNVSFSVVNLLSQGLTPATQSQVQAAMQSVIQSDERVQTCQVIVTFDGKESLQAKISVVPAVGQSFQFVVSIDKVSITLISIGYVNL